MSIDYFSYSQYLTEKYSAKTFRVSVDAGFSCPNRGKRRENHGCIYCDAHGARAVYLDRSAEIKKQIDTGTRFLKRRYEAEIFLLYLQAFTGTYGSCGFLKETWDYCLSLEKFRELIVSTRPDCIDEEKSVLLSSYIRDDFDVWVELGLQSCHNSTLKLINRGHSVEDFEKAFNILRAKGVKIIVHLIFGLPEETEEDMMESVSYVAALKPEGIKFHNLHVVKGTALEEQFMAGNFSVPCLLRHLGYLAEAISLLPSDMVIMRLTCDTPEIKRLSPQHDLEKGEVLSLLDKELKKRGLYQGKYYKAK